MSAFITKPGLRALGLALILFASGACTTPMDHADLPDLVIRDVTVIVGDGSPPKAGQSVLVRDGRIQDVVTAGRYRAPASVQIIDGAGRHLLPGFVDTHAHIAMGPLSLETRDGAPSLSLSPDDIVTTSSLRSLLTHGVTTARDPGGRADITVAARRRVDSGQLFGPRLKVAGEVIDTTRFENLATTVDSPAAVRAEVDRQAAEGADWIKLYAGLNPEMVRAGIETAHGHGLKVTGHLMSTSWTQAADMGIDSLVHIIPGSPDLLPPAGRQIYAQSQTNSLFMLRWFDLADPNGPQIREMIHTLKARRVSVDPTLVVFHAMANGDRPEYTQNPALAYAAPSLVANWRSSFTMNIGWTAGDFEEARRIWPKVEQFTKLLFDEGVMLTAGTDANNPWIVPGDSFHKELELLVRAGIRPLDALTIATRNGAEVLGLLAETGTVTPGKRADLVLLNGDPTKDIRATRQIEWVMKDGRVYRPEALLDRP